MPIKHLKTILSKEKKDKDLEKKIKRKNWGTLIGQIAIFAFLFLAIVFIGFVAVVSRDLPNTDGLINSQVPESSKIYDRTGTIILYEIHGEEKRTSIEIDTLPEYVPNAFIAIEDKDFYKHHGLVWKRVVKMLYEDSMYYAKKILIPKFIRTALSIKLNKFQGASTITQQLVKNAILSPEKTLVRKLKEMILAYQLEGKFTKKQILKMYLNEISYGGVNFGLEAAAQSYFGKSAKDLTIAEAATLAALINVPSALSPYGENKEALLQRKDFVLSLMLEQNLISQEQYDEAKAQELKFKAPKTGIIAPHFVMYVQDLLAQGFGQEYGENLLKEGGLKIYTTLDANLQKKAEESITNSLENLKKQDASNAALVAINPKNGEILAMVGSVDYFDEENQGNFNAALGLRQPGSSMKPLVYALAFDKGYYPETVLYDVLTNFSNNATPYIPKNYDLKERGQVTMRTALAGSLNIPAVKTLYLVGVNEVVKKAQEMGYTTLTDPDRYGLALVLGGAEVKLLEHVSAFGAFANDGQWNATQALLKVTDRQGNILKEYKSQPKQVLSFTATRMLNSVLSDNNARAYVFGANNSLMIKDRNVAAKTGTTNDYRDAWTVGYTPSLVAGVWVGNNNNEKMKAGGVMVAAPIWQSFMEQALQGTENENFLPPPPNTSDKPVLNGSIFGGLKVKIDKISGKLATDFTPPELIEEKSFMDLHSILYYVDKNNPAGPPLADPSQDAQYERWEKGISNWRDRYNEQATKENKPLLSVSSPPTETDDVHVPENIPNLTILYPNINETIIDSHININVDVAAKRGVSQVMYYINDKALGAAFNYPFSFSYDIVGLPNGIYTLKAKACDDVLNCRQAQTDFNLLLANPFSPVEIINPRDNAVFFTSMFPLTISLEVYDNNDIGRLKLYYRLAADPSANATLIASLNEIAMGFNQIKWPLSPLPDSYVLYIAAEKKDGTILPGRQIMVTIK